MYVINAQVLYTLHVLTIGSRITASSENKNLSSSKYFCSIRKKQTDTSSIVGNVKSLLTRVHVCNQNGMGYNFHGVLWLSLRTGWFNKPYVYQHTFLLRSRLRVRMGSLSLIDGSCIQRSKKVSLERFSSSASCWALLWKTKQTHSITGTLMT